MMTMLRFILCTVFFLMTLVENTAWASGGRVVVVPESPLTLHRQKRQMDNNAAITPAVIQSMDILSQTSSRYTQVTINSVVVNPSPEPREASFIVQIPERAFISNFSMLINETIFVAQVMEKEAADKEYEEAQNRGETAGRVGIAAKPPPRGMENFMININVAGHGSVEFQLLYQDLLERRFGIYRQKISLRPGQIIQDLTVNAELYEPQGFTSFKFARPGESQLSESSKTGLTLKATPNMRQITYTPPVGEQNRTAGNSVGLDGDLVIEYDVNHLSGGGELVIEDGYFVHHISPSGLPTLDKNVIFVIDVSGSMGGYKIEQTREAMLGILSQLRENDYFNILLFSSDVKLWQEKPVLGSQGNIRQAKGFVQTNVQANGGTNIGAALDRAGSSLSDLVTGLSGSRGKMIIFLTDGMPSSGETNTFKIREIVRRWNRESRLPIFSLGFGKDVSFEFLQQLSAENYGFARKIYYDTVQDAGSQLETFFTEVESILLVDVTVTYQDGAVVMSSLSTTSFPQYFKGTELVIAGQIQPSAPTSWTGKIIGGGKTNTVRYDISVGSSNLQDTVAVPWASGFAEKVHAYLKINDLIRDMSIEQDPTKKEALKKEALELSLRYNFVTPVTSMVIVQKPSPQQHAQEDRAHSAGIPTLAKSGNNRPYDSVGMIGGYAGAGVSMYTSSTILTLLLVLVQIFN